MKPSSSRDRATPRAVVFDIGGVLIDWDPRHLYRKLFPGDKAAMEHFLAEVCSPEWNLQQDAGRPFAEGVAELAARYPGHADLIGAFDTRWEEMVAGPIAGTVEIVEALAARRTPLYALTNFSAEKFALFRPRLSVLDRFDGIVVSGEIGLIKPDLRIYRHLLGRFDLTAGNCVFVDDNPANVAAAADLGFVALRFTTPGGLRRMLTDLGVL